MTDHVDNHACGYLAQIVNEGLHPWFRGRVTAAGLTRLACAMITHGAVPARVAPPAAALVVFWSLVQEIGGCDDDIRTVTSSIATASRLAEELRIIEAAVRRLPTQVQQILNADDLLKAAALLDCLVPDEEGQKDPDLIRRAGRPRYREFRSFVRLLAEADLMRTGRWPSVTHDPITGACRGRFIELVEETLSLWLASQKRTWWPATAGARAHLVDRILKEGRRGKSRAQLHVFPLGQDCSL